MQATRARLAALIASDAAVLVALRPRLGLVHRLGNPHRWVGDVGGDAAAAELASAALWLTGAWLAVGLAAMLAAAVPGACGRAGNQLARAVLPRAVYRLAAGAAGMGVLLCPVVAGATAPAHATTTGRPMDHAAPAPTWPTDDPLPAPAWPTAESPSPAIPRSPDLPSRSSPSPSAPSPAVALQSPPIDAAAANAVVVKPGDSLWQIAAERLPGNPSAKRVAAQWPRWYAANRRVIGEHPSHIVPGQVLHAPLEEDQS